MKILLDKEFPEKKKRRYPILILFSLGLVAAALSVYLIQNDDSLIKAEQDIQSALPQTQLAVATTLVESTASTDAEKTSSSEKLDAQVTQASTTMHTPSVTETSANQSSHTLLHNNTTENPSTPTLTPSSTSHNNSLPIAFEDKAPPFTSKRTTPASLIEDKFTERELIQVAALQSKNANSRLLHFNEKPLLTLSISDLAVLDPIAIPKPVMRWGIQGGGAYSFGSRSSSVEMGLHIGLTKGKWHWGIETSAGYVLGDRTSVNSDFDSSVPVSIDSNAGNTMNPVTNPGEIIIIIGDMQRPGLIRNVEETHTNLTSSSLYFEGNVDMGYQVYDKLRTTAGLGTEILLANSPTSSPLGDTRTEQSYVPFITTGLDYEISRRWDVALSLRYKSRKVDDRHRILVKTRYHF